MIKGILCIEVQNRFLPCCEGYDRAVATSDGAMQHKYTR